MAYGTRQSEMRKWLESQGVVFSDGGEFRPLILNCIGEIATIFPGLFGTLSDFYFFDQTEQLCQDGKTSDGIFWFHTSSKGAILYAIGVSTAAAAEGEEYLLLCILHELAHIVDMIEHGESSHRASFHTALDGLIRIFNEATGKKIKNDFCGLQMRHDSRTWTLPHNIPTQSRKQGQEFRHG